MSRKHSEEMRRRWAKRTPAERSEVASRMAKVRWSRVSPRRRSEHGTMMNEAKRLKDNKQTR